MRTILWIAPPNEPLRRIIPSSYQDLSFHFCDSIAQAAETVHRMSPFLVIIDADRQEISALDLCFNLQDLVSDYKSNVIILSSSKDPQLEIDAFRAGAVDFVGKPIHTDALLSRLVVRSGGEKTKPSDVGIQENVSLRIDKDNYSVYLNQQLVLLSRKEFELLHLLASHPGKVFTREEIFDRVWNKNTDQKDRTIDVHILRLRKKIGENRITTQKGIGYRLMI